MNTILEYSSINHTKARALHITTAHSTIKTPVFMPVGTQATIKSLDSSDMLALGASIILANTYHLYLRPGEKTIAKLGGLHGFSKFPHSFLTDSGGFQAFSLSHNTQHKQDGILFKSHIDGSRHLFTPQKVLDIQYALNSDIMMILDDLVGLPAHHERLQTSVDNTSRWAEESIKYHQTQKQLNPIQNAIFAIIQGGTNKQLRIQSANALTSLPFDGYAIGGLAVGEENTSMYETIAYTTDFMPAQKPRYLMGVGTPEDIIEGIHQGIDMFDCVMPTRNARNGTLFTSFGKISIKSSVFKTADKPIDETCSCYTCTHHSLAYLNHLFRSKEITYYRLASLHNLYYYLNLMKQARKAILNNTFITFRQEFYTKRAKEIPQYDGNIF